MFVALVSFNDKPQRKVVLSVWLLLKNLLSHLVTFKRVSMFCHY